MAGRMTSRELTEGDFEDEGSRWFSFAVVREFVI